MSSYILIISNVIIYTDFGNYGSVIDKKNIAISGKFILSIFLLLYPFLLKVLNNLI